MGEIYEFPLARRESGRDYFLWAGLFFFMLARYFVSGFVYYPVMDDFGRYGVFYRLSENLSNILPMYAESPFSGDGALSFLLDAVFYSRLWNQLWIVVLLVSTMNFACAFLLHSIFEKCGLKFGVTGIAAVILPFPALFHESLYAASASVRMISGLFYMIVSVWFFVTFIEKLFTRNKKAGFYFSGYWLFGLLSLGYSSQIAAVSVVFSAVIIFINRKRLPLFSLVSSFGVLVLNCLIIAIVSTLAGNTGFAVNDYIWLNNFGVISTGFFERFSYSLPAFIKGLEQTDSVAGYIVIFAILLFCGFLFYRLIKGKMPTEISTGKRKRVRLAIGILLFAVPIVIAPPVDGSEVWNYSFVPSLPGTAVLADVLLDSIEGARILINGKKVNFLLVKAVIVPIFIAASVIMAFPLSDEYRGVSETDVTLATEFVRIFEESEYVGKNAEGQQQPLLVLNATDTNGLHSSISRDEFAYRNIISCVNNKYMFNGIINSISQRNFFNNLSPVSDGGKLAFDILHYGAVFGFSDRSNDDMAVYELFAVENGGIIELFIKNTDKRFGIINDNIFYKN